MLEHDTNLGFALKFFLQFMDLHLLLHVNRVIALFFVGLLVILDFPVAFHRRRLPFFLLHHLMLTVPFYHFGRSYISRLQLLFVVFRVEFRDFLYEISRERFLELRFTVGPLYF